MRERVAERSWRGGPAHHLNFYTIEARLSRRDMMHARCAVMEGKGREGKGICVALRAVGLNRPGL